VLSYFAKTLKRRNYGNNEKGGKNLSAYCSQLSKVHLLNGLVKRFNNGEPLEKKGGGKEKPV